MRKRGGQRDGQRERETEGQREIGGNEREGGAERERGQREGNSGAERERGGRKRGLSKQYLKVGKLQNTCTHGESHLKGADFSTHISKEFFNH